VGNIYANEALFRAGIKPTRPAESLSKRDCMALFIAIQAVLREAIGAGGTTLRDYVQADGKLGYFHEHFRVYGREGQGCNVCSHPIQKAVIGQRGTWWCGHCQK
ncbi:MAG: zinc finger domain-containing protein, partial [Alphaproteobacteria bacterium]